MAICASYFDGKSSRLYRVTLSVEGDIAQLYGDVERSCPLAELRVSEASQHGARIVTFPDGAYLEVDDAIAFAAMLHHTGHRDGVVVQLQQSWRATLLATLAIVLLLFLGWRYLLPALADAAALAMPASVERALGERMLQLLDDRMMAASTLAPERREAIRKRFQQMLPADGAAPRLLFRSSRIGPNALTLPDRRILLTDELVALLKDDEDALMAVLAHEAGHLRRRHLMRRLVHDGATGAAMMALFGDASGMLAALPAIMLGASYSRDVEREADEEAASLLLANGLAPAKLADALEKLASGRKDPPLWLSTHPPTPERIAHLRGALPAK
jgi:Zn-dependent protease with chaperone function